MSKGDGYRFMRMAGLPDANKIDFLRCDSILAALLVLDLSFFEQLMRLQNTIRRIVEEGLVTHPGLDDYMELEEAL